MSKRKREDVAEIKTNEDAEDTEISATKGSKKTKPKRPRGKVSKHPIVKPKSDESENESDISNDKEEVLEKSVKKGRGKKATGKSNEKESSDEKEVKTVSRGRPAKATANKKVESEESDVDEVPAKKSKATKANQTKDEKIESKDSDIEEVPVKKARVTKAKPTKTKMVESEDSDIEEVPVKKGRTTKSKTIKKIINDTGDKPALKNKTSTSYEGEDFTSCESKNGKEWNFKISNWNVDGIRAWMKKGGLDYIDYEKPDILCIQETKCSDDKLPKEVKEIEGYKSYWISSVKDGYAGVGLYSRTVPLSVSYGIGDEEHDSEGRLITAEYEKFYVISVYVPNAGRKLVTLDKRLEWNELFRKYISDLDSKKPVIICGDMNVAHNEIDLKNPKTNHKNAGFTKEEREGMTEFLGDGFIDTFRNFYPDKTDAFTFWSYLSNARTKNIGWRLDYFIVSKRFLESICDNIIRSEVYGSDHCPITLFLSI